MHGGRRTRLIGASGPVGLIGPIRPGGPGGPGGPEERQRCLADVSPAHEVEPATAFRWIVSAMLQDEQAAGREYAPFAQGPDDFPGDGIAIGRIGEYDVHGTGMVGEVTETPNGIGHPDPAPTMRAIPVGRSRVPRPTGSARLPLSTGPARLSRRTTESTPVQVVPDHPDGAPVAIDKETAARAPAQGFNAQTPTAGAQIQHGAVDDPGRQDVKQRSAHAAAGGTDRTG